MSSVTGTIEITWSVDRDDLRLAEQNAHPAFMNEIAEGDRLAPEIAVLYAQIAEQIAAQIAEAAGRGVTVWVGDVVKTLARVGLRIAIGPARVTWRTP